MDADKQQLIRAWINKAASDLETAEILIEGTRKRLDTGVYHYHQAAEKMLKALLTAGDIPFPKTHNLQELLLLALPVASDLATLSDAAIELTPLATEFRYPGDEFEPSSEDAGEALQKARRLFRAIAAEPSIRNVSYPNASENNLLK